MRSAVQTTSLRREAEIHFSRDEIRPDEFTGTPEEGKAGEADELRGDEIDGAHRLARTQEDTPAGSAQNIDEIHDGNGGEHDQKVDRLGVNPESGPIEMPPRPHLQVDKCREDGDDDDWR